MVVAVQQRAIPRIAEHFETAQEHLAVHSYSSFTQVSQWREEWNQLVVDVGADLFASFDWCSTWWKHFHRDRALMIFLAFRGHRLVACIPLYREVLSYGPWRLHVVRLIGSGDAGTRTHLAIDPEEQEPVLREVCKRIDSQGPWDVLYLGDFPSNTFQTRAVADVLTRIFPSSKVILRSALCPTSTFDLPQSFEDYLGLLSPKERGSVRRTDRRLKEKYQASFEATAVIEFDETFDHFLELHAQWWANKGHVGYFRIWPGISDFHRDLSEIQARQGRLHLLKLKAIDQTIAYYYGHQFGSRIHAFAGARACNSQWDAISPGKQLHCEMVRRSIASGLKQIDSLVGYYSYKQVWGATYHTLQSITVLTENLASRLARYDFLLASRLHDLLNRAWFWHAAPWLRKILSVRTSSWLGSGLGSRYVRSRSLLAAVDNKAPDAICMGIP